MQINPLYNDLHRQIDRQERQEMTKNNNNKPNMIARTLTVQMLGCRRPVSQKIVDAEWDDAEKLAKAMDKPLHVWIFGIGATVFPNGRRVFDVE
jgi:hypothetical protein